MLQLTLAARPVSGVNCRRSEHQAAGYLVRVHRQSAYGSLLHKASKPEIHVGGQLINPARSAVATL